MTTKLSQHCPVSPGDRTAQEKVLQALGRERQLRRHPPCHNPQPSAGLPGGVGPQALCLRLSQLAA